MQQYFNQRFFPLEINFNSFFNTYFATTVSASFTFRSFQPKFYEFIKLRTISITSGFNLRQYVIFTSFQNPSNLFRPSLFSQFLQSEELFKNDRSVFFSSGCKFFTYPLRPFFFNFFNSFLRDPQQPAFFYPYQYTFENIFLNVTSSYTVKFNVPKILRCSPHQFRNLHVFSLLPSKIFKRVLVKQIFFNVSPFSKIGRNATRVFQVYRTLHYSFFRSEIFKRVKFFNFYFSAIIKSRKLFSTDNFFTFDDLYFSVFTPFTQLGVSKFYDQFYLLKRFNRKTPYTNQIPIFNIKNFSKSFLVTKRLLFANKYFK